MAGKNKVFVRIAGNEYTLCGNESAEYMQRIALYVDKKTVEIMRANHTLSTSMASVLTAVNITDEMFKTAGMNESLQKEVEQVKKMMLDLKQEKTALSQQVQKYSEENRHLVLELAKREAELAEVRNASKRNENPPPGRLHHIK